MSNNIGGNPLVLDTANTTTAADPRNLIITGVHWSKATAAGHEMILQDGSGRELYHFVANAANYDEESNNKAYCQGGLILHTLGSGTVRVHIK